MKKVLFIDQDGTLVAEPKENYQLDSWWKLKFLPGVIRNLSKICSEMDYELVLVTNQDGLGTEVFPEEPFLSIHRFILETLQQEGIRFSQVCIDRSFPQDNAPTRKPATGMLTNYLGEEYDLEKSFVIGDRPTDIQLAYNLGAKGIYIKSEFGYNMLEEDWKLLDKYPPTTQVNSWNEIYSFLKLPERTATVERNSLETQIKIDLKLNGSGQGKIKTGLHFFDHMLDQLCKHGLLDLIIEVKGDLEIDEHHTIEDTAIALGSAFKMALGNKLGIERYGYALPMDDCLAQVMLDFGGRPWLIWDAEFKREKIGDMPTEMFMHFFKSFSDAAQCNLAVKAYGTNEHHKIEGIFKAFAKAIKMAVKQDPAHLILPSTKGML